MTFVEIKRMPQGVPPAAMVRVDENIYTCQHIIMWLD